MARNRNKKTVQEDYYLTGTWDDGRHTSGLLLTKKDFDYIKKNNKIPKSCLPLKTEMYKSIGLKVVKTTWFPEKPVK
jgi:hypothetical protein